MNIWENAVITNKGIALLAKIMSGETLNITRGEIGSGYVTPGILQNQVAVSRPMQQVSFRDVTYPEEGKCALPCVITNDSIDTAYTANQVGIYATDPDEGEILFFITQAANGKGIDIPTETEMPGYSAEWTFYFKYGQAGSVHVTVDPSNTVSFAEVEAHVNAKLAEHTSKANPHKVTAEQVGALPSTGGIVKGQITFKKGDNPGSARVTKNHSETADYGLVMTDYEKDGKSASVVVRAKENNAYFIDNDNNYHKLYHEGNKKSLLEPVLLTSEDDLNMITENGYYYWRTNNRPQNAPTDSEAGKLTAMRVWTEDGITCFQELADMYTGATHSCIMRRTVDGSDIYPFEWVNPPMTIGVEYRTVERYDNEPVFVTLQSNGIVKKRTDYHGIIAPKTENWVFTLEDGSTVTKAVYIG